MNKTITKASLIALILTSLCACSSNKEQSAVCSLESDGLTLSISVTAPGEEEAIDSLSMSVTGDYDTLGIDTTYFDDLQATFEDALIESIASSLSMEEETLSYTSDYSEEGFTLTFTLEEDALDAFVGEETITVDNFMESFTNAGYTCE